MSTKTPITIVGAGLAGYGVIRELRKLDSEVPITLITQDDGAFYSKPRLSSHLSSGRSLESLVSSTGEDMAQKNNFTLLKYNNLLSINAPTKQLSTQHGEQAYGKLVLAMGAVPRQPSYQHNSKSIFSVNHLADYLRLVPRLTQRQTVVIYGGGLVACEFANDLALAGHDVHLVTRSTSLLDRLVTSATSELLAKALQIAGIHVRLGCDIQQITETTQGLQINFDQGSPVLAHIVLNAIGLIPHPSYHSLGLRTERGIVVNEYLQTNLPEVYAIGDGAQYPEGWLPFVMPIGTAAKTLAQNLLGQEAKLSFPPMPVAVKTPAFPIVIGPHSKPNLLHSVDITDGGCAETWRDEQGRLRGFVLGGHRCADKATFMKEWLLQ